MIEPAKTAATRCPVADCTYGATETKAFEQVAQHVKRVDDAAHDRAQRRRDWSYEFVQIE